MGAKLGCMKKESEAQFTLDLATNEKAAKKEDKTGGDTEAKDELEKMFDALPEQMVFPSEIVKVTGITSISHRTNGKSCPNSITKRDKNSLCWR